MAFDAERYDREVIKPLRGHHGRLPPGDLAARYAVEPGWTRAELIRHLTVVRRFWQDSAVGPDSRAEICRLLIRADEELIRTVGDSMTDPAWWQEHGARASRPRESMRRRIRDAMAEARHFAAPPPTTGPAPVRAGGGAVDPSWQAEVRSFVLARLEDPAGATTSPVRPADTAGGAGADRESTTAGDTGSATTAGVPELTVSVLGARGDRCRVRVSWPDAGGREVRVHRCASPPPWTVGSALPMTVLDTFGEELTGARETSDGETGFVAEVPVGYHLYVPFVIDGERLTAGRFVALGIAEPVRRLQAERRGEDVVLTWIWPHGARRAVVEWPAPGGTMRHEVTRSAYAGANGFRIPAGTRQSVARVVVVTDVVGDEVRSAVREVTLPARPVAVSYSLHRSPLWRAGRRRITVRLQADAVLVGVTATVVLGSEPTMPGSVEEGSVLAVAEHLELRPERPHDLEVAVPSLPRRAHPYWIRCFVHGPVPTVVALPAVGSMKVT
ncbi:hypothetical protein AB0B20_26785 [Micromonospora sp. NPDC049151]|uniref:hypothetical protein n=1 Tax=Micromonospora sp. NPDC049151 TaxID=3155648 RepID=UPI0033ED41F3